MSIRHEENDIYIIPPNFIDTGTVFGGTIKIGRASCRERVVCWV